MKIFLSYILLFLYTLTCTGSSVYMHLCGKGSIAIIQVQQPASEKECPLCAKTEKKSAAKHACSDKDDCCKDVKLDLKKGNQEIESTANSPTFLALSPAVITLYWIMLVPQEASAITQSTVSQPPPQLASASPPYLIHCNFRI